MTGDQLPWKAGTCWCLLLGKEDAEKQWSLLKASARVTPEQGPEWEWEPRNLTNKFSLLALNHSVRERAASCSLTIKTVRRRHSTKDPSFTHFQHIFSWKVLLSDLDNKLSADIQVVWMLSAPEGRTRLIWAYTLTGFYIPPGKRSWCSVAMKKTSEMTEITGRGRMGTGQRCTMV